MKKSILGLPLVFALSWNALAQAQPSVPQKALVEAILKKYATQEHLEEMHKAAQKISAAIENKVERQSKKKPDYAGAAESIQARKAATEKFRKLDAGCKDFKLSDVDPSLALIHGDLLYSPRVVNKGCK